MGQVLDCLPVNLGTAELSAQVLKIKEPLGSTKNKFSFMFQISFLKFLIGCCLSVCFNGDFILVWMYKISANFSNKVTSIHKCPERINRLFNTREFSVTPEYLIYLHIVIGIQK